MDHVLSRLHKGTLGDRYLCPASIEMKSEQLCSLCDTPEDLSDCGSYMQLIGLCQTLKLHGVNKYEAGGPLP